jgi:hypothetical protein
MALSLRCNDCGLLLRSVKEAQDHGEATGHSNFEESTEALLSLQCTECGKVCRSQTEKDLHQKRTGHATYLDKVCNVAMIWKALTNLEVNYLMINRTSELHTCCRPQRPWPSTQRSR